LRLVGNRRGSGEGKIDQAEVRAVIGARGRERKSINIHENPILLACKRKVYNSDTVS
jgi:hypothetical protein